MASLLAVLLVFGVRCASADLDIYVDDGLGPTWQNWSWGSTISFNATDLADGSTSISVASGPWSALSLYTTTPFSDQYAGLSFDLASDNPDFSIYLTDVANDVNSLSIPISAFELETAADSFTTFVLDFNNVPPNGGSIGDANWDRITFQSSASDVSYHIDNLRLLTEIVVTPEFLSAEPLGNNLLAITSKGDVEFSSVKATLNGKEMSIRNTTSYTPPDTPAKSITYLVLNTSLAPGELSISVGDLTATYSLPSSQKTRLNTKATYAISPWIYGTNWPPSQSYIGTLGTTISRWGGNAVTAYNPNGDFTNAGADWYFMNRKNDVSADDWLGMIHGTGSASMLTVPALDWVAKDATSYSYPKALYPNQAAYEPFNNDAGNGRDLDGNPVQPPMDQNTVYVPWTPSDAQTWLEGLANKPSMVTIDNEIEIASSTHQDMHPDPVGFDEEFERVKMFATVSKAALPDVPIGAPSTCAWWFYWTSVIGWSDNEAHDNMDFLPWFLSQMAAHEAETGSRILDYLDIHYYFAPDTSANDDAAKALRLRMTRSWWDTTYVDESWIGESPPQNHQPNATIVQLIPRMKALIDELYPGTKISVGEWSASTGTDVTGGLVVADSLGIFGRHGLDAATYWGDAGITAPVGLAYWLYRGQGTTFGDLGAMVAVDGFDPNVLGVYASTNEDKSQISLVIVNKDTKPVSLNLEGLGPGEYFVRHFGGQAGVAKYQTVQVMTHMNYFVVPSYTALFLQSR